MDLSNMEPFGTESNSAAVDQPPPHLAAENDSQFSLGESTLSSPVEAENVLAENPIESDNMLELDTPIDELNTPMVEVNTPMVKQNSPMVEHEVELNTPMVKPNSPAVESMDDQNTLLVNPDSPVLEHNAPVVTSNTPLKEPDTQLDIPNIESAPSEKIELESPFHSSTVLTELQALQREQILCDVRLTTDTGGVSAHKVVLMATSPSMRLRLATGDTKNELIHFDNIPLSLLETVVKYMYTGKLNFDSSCKDQLMKFCEDLELSCAVNLLTDYTKSDGAFDSSEATEDESYFPYKSRSDSRTKLRSSTGKHSEKKETTKRSDKDSTKSKKTNRRVKQTPKKRTAKTPVVELEDLAETAPDKLLKLSSDVLIQKVLEQGIIKEEPQVHQVPYSGRGRPRKNSLRPPKKIKKATKRSADSKSKYVKKVKKEKTEGEMIEYDENGEKIYDFTQVTPERYKTSRREVNALKSVISANTAAETNSSPQDTESAMRILKTEKMSDDEQDPDFSGETDDNVEKKKPKKKTTPWSRRKKQPCPMCDKILSTKKRLVFHLYCQHGIEYDRAKYRMYYCPVEGCGHVSSSCNNLRTHTRSRHATDRPHVCEFCGKSFKLQGVLSTHLNLHTQSKVFKCKKCGETFNQHSGLDVHIKRYHMGESSFSELCHLCSEKFLQKSDLCWHLFRVHDQPLPENYKAYTCDKCDFVSKSVQDFERHMNAHAGIKNWVCSICQKTCARKSELKVHLKYHGEKKFKCTYENCTYACVDDVGLQKHIQLNHTHKHFKPYVCSVCKYKTGVKGNLDKHIRQVHNLEVVSKHTVPLKMKYKDFQQGDIITKDMQLVVSVQEREKLYKEELVLLQCSQTEHGEFKDAEDTRIKQITKKRKTAAERKKPIRPSQQSESIEELTLNARNAGISASAETADASAHLESEFGVPLSQVDKYKNQPSSQSSSFQADMNTPLFGNPVFPHNQSLPPHMALGLGAHDLRMGMAAQLAGAHLYPEELQAYAEAAMEHNAMNK